MSFDYYNDLIGFPSKNTAKLVENILINGTQIKNNKQEIDSHEIDFDDNSLSSNSLHTQTCLSTTVNNESSIPSTKINKSQKKVPGIDFNIDYFLREPISDATEIVEGVWIGGEESGCDQSFLRKERIQTVVNVSDSDDYIHKKGLQYIHTPFVNSLEYIDAVVTFIYESRLRGSVLIHCNTGDQHSATIVVAYIMKIYGKTMYDAIKIVQTFRTTALQPCVTFVELLIHYSYQYIKKSQKMRIQRNKSFK